MGSIVVTVLVILWLAVLVPAAIAPMFMSRGPASRDRRPDLAQAVPIAERRRADATPRVSNENLAA